MTNPGMCINIEVAKKNKRLQSRHLFFDDDNEQTSDEGGQEVRSTGLRVK